MNFKVFKEKKKDSKKCCWNCLKLDNCKILENTKEYKDLNGEDLEDKQFDFQEEYVCDEFDSRYIEYPLTISGININTDTYTYTLMESGIGKFVSIRIVGEDKKTYLGLFLGDLPIDMRTSLDIETNTLRHSFKTNPAIFIFDLNRIVYGCESWWGFIKTEEQLKKITNKDIENVWYIKALKQLSK